MDYQKVVAKTQPKIRKYGRPITLVDPSTTPLDSQRPWDGSEAGEGLLPISGLFIPPNQVRIFGLSALGDATEVDDLIKFSEQIIIVCPGEVDLETYEMVRDQDGSDWEITAYQTLKPGEVTLLGYLGVRR